MYHERKCRNCDNVGYHEDNVTPYVNCKSCGSQDTRPIKNPRCSIAAEIAVALAAVAKDDYQGHLDAITAQLDRFGLPRMATEKIKNNRS